MSKFVSLGLDAIYQDFEWNDSEVPRDQIGNVDPQSARLLEKLSEVRTYKIPLPVAFGANLPDTVGNATYHNRVLSERAGNGTNTNFNVWLAELQNVCVQGRRVYLVNQDYAQLFELNRVVDRPFLQPELEQSERQTQGVEYTNLENPTLLLTSAGSFNWGHFLIDELPRVVGYVEAMKPSVLSVALISWHDQNLKYNLDQRRREAIEALFPELQVEIKFLDQSAKYYFSKLLYVTPVSMHPTVKPVELIGRLRARYMENHNLSQEPIKILALRSGARNLKRLGQAKLVRYFTKLNFVPIYPERLSAIEQFKLFSNASHVVGLYGAALTSTVFSYPGSKQLAISPINTNELADPFYLDVSGIVGQHHFIYYYTRALRSKGIQDSIKLKFRGFSDFVEKSGFLD